MSQRTPPYHEMSPNPAPVTANGSAQDLLTQNTPPLTVQPGRPLLLSATRRRYDYINYLVFIVAGIGIVLFRNFTAEDAFITYRYAENFVNLGALVFNEGEPVNALTSPLHALLSAALYAVTGNTPLSNKIVALLFLSASALLIWHKFHNQRQLQYLALALVLMPPSVLLWTFGGLETPLLLFLVTATLVMVDRSPALGLRFLTVVFFLTGLAFLTRYDSVLFFLPLLVHAITKARTFRHVFPAMAGAAILPVAWFAFSVYYYGDPLPTSFYVKTPDMTAGSLRFNGLYIALYLLFIGLIPAFSLVFILLQPTQRPLTTLYSHIRRMWWLYLGLGLELIYGLTMATHHMMFSFRFFVPYIPAAAILVVDIIRQASRTGDVDLSSSKVVTLIAGSVVILSLFQVYQSIYTYRLSINGITPIGEYQTLSVRDYVEFIAILKQQAHDLESHWNDHKSEALHQPRILTYAAGALPYTFRDSYIYEQLVSYRHCYQRYQQGRHANYIHIIAPRHGEINEQLPPPQENYSLVSSYEMIFDGSRQKLLVYYNSQPEDHNLGPRIDSACRTSP